LNIFFLSIHKKCTIEKQTLEIMFFSFSSLFTWRSVLKVARWKKRLCVCSHHTANLNFLFLSLCIYLFKNFPSQFFSHWKSAEPVFCSEDLSNLHCKNQNKSLPLSYLVGKFKFVVCWEHKHKCFFPSDHLNQYGFLIEIFNSLCLLAFYDKNSGLKKSINLIKLTSKWKDSRTKKTCCRHCVHKKPINSWLFFMVCFLCLFLARSLSSE